MRFSPKALFQPGEFSIVYFRILFSASLQSGSV
jgi:hypothetical protein